MADGGYGDGTNEKQICDTLPQQRDSATSPLHVYICASQFCDADLALFLPHVGRMEVLQIVTCSVPSLVPFFSSKFPVLKTLELLDTGSKGELYLSAERFPCLQSLEIMGNSKVPGDPQIYASLHTLSLENCPSDLSLGEFFDLLSVFEPQRALPRRVSRPSRPGLPRYIDRLPPANSISAHEDAVSG